VNTLGADTTNTKIKTLNLNKFGVLSFTDIAVHCLTIIIIISLIVEIIVIIILVER